ncbi:MAG: mannose-6-phosphate isomerase, class I [Thermodesulfobacteriota bacterium]|nr:mannose-6-phosphate isomerase, class I [Thermodesulfobacteriota bacterium]
MNKIAILKNPVLDYAWGSRTFIPQLTGEPHPAGKPLAELWMGAHPKAPSMVFMDGGWVSLLELIQNNPEDILGKSVAERFSNKLPFLFKVLAITKSLSIQAHPDMSQAIDGFRRENSLKLSLNAPNRNYRDENHKPELICALRPLWALKGFRRAGDIVALLNKITGSSLKSELCVLQEFLKKKGLRGFFNALMNMDRERKNQIIAEVMTYGEKNSGADLIFEWVVRLNQEYPGDIGVLSPIFMNLVQLQPGEAIYIPAGELHAYLEGAGIELMANSDNVLRGGLTPKHIDVPELLTVLEFSSSRLDIIRPENKETGESIFCAPAKEFILSVISVNDGLIYKGPLKRSVEIMICVEGDSHIKDLGSGEVLLLKRGTSIIIPSAVRQYAIKGRASIYKGAVPL